MEEELKTIETVDTSPFKHLVMTLGELPTSFVDSMTYYECLAWLVNFIQNTVIPTVNNNAEAVEELQTAFITLKNYVDTYFDNLDVQDEVNNKLDEMAEDGSLLTLLSNYTSLQKNFDSVQDMINDTSLVKDSLVKCFGFSTINDGNGGEFIITDVEDEIQLTNGLYAKRINDYTNNYYNFDYTMERHNNTDVYFVTIPKYNAYNQIVMPYVGIRNNANQSPNQYAMDNHTSLTINASLTIKAPEGSGITTAIPSIISNGEIVRNNDNFVGSSLADNYLYLGIKSDRTLEDYKVNETTANQLLADGCVQAFDVYYKLIDNYFPVDLTNVVTNEEGVVTNPNPRQVIAELNNGDIMIMTCDGRTDYDTGLTSAEMQTILISKNVKNAWNLDGGGSTSTSINGFKINKDIDVQGTEDRLIPYTLNVSHPLVNKSRSEENSFIAKVTDKKVDKIYREMIRTKGLSGSDVDNLKGSLIVGYGNNLTNIPSDIDSGGYFINMTNPIEQNRGLFNTQFLKHRFKDILYMRTETNQGWSSWKKLYPAPIHRVLYTDYTIAADTSYETLTPSEVSFSDTDVDIDNNDVSVTTAENQTCEVEYICEITVSSAVAAYFKLKKNGTDLKIQKINLPGSGTYPISIKEVTKLNPTDKISVQCYGKTGNSIIRGRLFIK